MDRAAATKAVYRIAPMAQQFTLTKGERGGMPPQPVAIAIHEGVQALDVAGPVDASAEANGFVTKGQGYETVLVAANLQPLRTSNCTKIAADMTFADADGFAILLVAGGPAMPEAEPDPDMLQW